MLRFSNAKVNLGLNVLSVREDGYHNLQSVLLPIGWSDVLEILPTDGMGTIALEVTGLVPDARHDQNLCVKAYELLNSHNPLPSIKMHLHKVVPSGAGLGGGSSNAAFTLAMLNELFTLKYSKDQLKDFAAELGSDCPFFIENAPCWIEGRGERVVPAEIPQLAGRWITVVNPGIHISTAEAFQEITPGIPEWPIKEALSGPIEEWMGKITNDFEPYVFEQYPAVLEIRNKLLEEGALYAAMSGTGSTVYGVFPGPNSVAEMFPGCLVWEGAI